MEENTLEQSGNVFMNATEGFIADLVDFLPDLLAGIIILIIGIIVASILGSLARRAVRYLHIDRFSQESETTQRLKEAGVEFSPSGMVGSLVKWFFIIVTFVAVADTIGLEQVTDFLADIIGYVPNVIAAILILVIGIVLGDILQRIVRASAAASEVVPGSGQTLGSVARWAVVTFSIFAALSELGVAENLIQILVAGIVLAFALAVGISVGLGAKDKVSSLINGSGPGGA